MSQTMYDSDLDEGDTDLDLDSDTVEVLDEDAPDDLLDEGDETSAEEQGAATAKSTQRGLSRGAIRRIATKAQEIATTDERILTIASGLLGTGTGMADLTTAIMSAPRSVSAPITDLTTIANSDPMEAGVNAAAMGRDRIKAVWALLASLDAGSKTPMPAANAKAAIAVARAVFGLDDTAKADLASVAALLKKN